MQNQASNNVVMTLDAGGTNFVFSAISGFKTVVDPINIPSEPDNLDKCLDVLIKGFEQVKAALGIPPVAISFAFPGPSDYAHGVIGDLPNFPAFRGGVALGAFLEEHFGIPVYINNDGNLYALGEAIGGVLPEVNAELQKAGNPKRYSNLLGITLGTGFGAGVVIDGKLLRGDNGTGGDVWCMRNSRYGTMIAEESVAKRAVPRVYQEVSGLDASALTPKDIFDIAEGDRLGDRRAAIVAFQEMGEVCGDTIANALNIVDGIVVLAGGLAHSHKYLMPGLMRSLHSRLYQFTGNSVPCLQEQTYDLTNPEQRKLFLKPTTIQVRVPRSNKMVNYDQQRTLGVTVSKMGASQAIAIGAYAYALQQIGERIGQY